jgi:hypothetical protein
VVVLCDEGWINSCRSSLSESSDNDDLGPVATRGIPSSSSVFIAVTYYKCAFRNGILDDGFFFSGFGGGALVVLLAR